MKKLLFVILTVAISFGQCLFQDALAQTSAELMDKSIAFHDPLKKWENYSGKVYLTTVFANGNSSGGELIEIQTKDDFYQCTRNNSKVIIGVRNGKCNREIDGNKNPGEDLIKKFNISEENILRSKAWHYFHFGILMELKASGLVLQKDIETVKLEGKDYKTIKFVYDVNKLKNQFYKESSVAVYIDPNDFSIKGFRIEGPTNMYALFSGILTINDIKIPLCRTYFNNNDNSFRFVDVFSLTGIN